jgi:hypothetical protein
MGTEGKNLLALDEQGRQAADEASQTKESWETGAPARGVLAGEECFHPSGHAFAGRGQGRGRRGIALGQRGPSKSSGHELSASNMGGGVLVGPPFYREAHLVA